MRKESVKSNVVGIQIILLLVLGLFLLEPSITGRTVQDISEVQLNLTPPEGTQVLSNGDRLYEESSAQPIAEKIEDDEMFETHFVTTEKSSETLTLIFYHNSSTAQPVWVEGLAPSDYSLSTANAQPLEHISLVVPLVNNQVPKFNLHIGKTSEVFQFGITIINVQSNPLVGNNWTVSFTTSGTGDLKVETAEGTKWGYDINFTELKCGNTIMPTTFDGTTVGAKGWSCNERGHEIARVITTGKHVLKFTFGDSTAYAYNHAFNSTTIDNCGTLEQQGYYTLAQNISTSGMAGQCLNIVAHNVTVDCVRYNITYTVGAASAQGIEINNGTQLRNITIKNCGIISDGGSSDLVGVLVINATNVTIYNTTIRTAGTDRNHGIHLQNVTYANISYVNITTAQTGQTLNHGIFITHNSRNNIISQTRIFANASSEGSNGIGIYINESTSTSVSFTRIRTRSISTSTTKYGAAGIALSPGSDDNNFTSISINASNSITDGIFIDGARGNLFTNLTINATKSGIRIIDALNNTINETYLRTTIGWANGGFGDTISQDGPLTINITTNASIIWLVDLNISNATNLAEVLFIGANRTQLNTSDPRGKQLNKTAIILINTTNETNEDPYVASDDQNYAVCTRPRCEVMSFDAVQSLKFNITGWSTYRGGPATFGAQIITNASNDTLATADNSTFSIVLKNNATNQTNYNLTVQNLNGAQSAVLNESTATLNESLNQTFLLTVKTANSGNFNVTVTARAAGNGSINHTTSNISITFTNFVNVRECRSMNTSNTFYNVTQNVSNATTCFPIAASNITLDCNGYNITSENNANSGRYGIVVGGRGISPNNVTIKNCRISHEGGPASDLYGVWLFNTTNVTLFNNTISSGVVSSTPSDNNFAVFLEHTSSANITFNNLTSGGMISSHALAMLNSTGNHIKSNEINVEQITSGTGRSHGIYLRFSSTNTFIDNDISTNMTRDNDGIFLNLSSNNSFTRTRIVTSTQRSHGINIEGSRNNSFHYTNITLLYRDPETFGIKLFNSNETVFNNTFIRVPSAGGLGIGTNWIGANANNTNFTNTTFSDANIRVSINHSFIYNGSAGNISAAAFNMTTDFIYLNSSGFPELNKSAEIIVDSTYNDPRVMVDLNNDGAFDACDATHCAELNYSNNTFRFNVTHFTAYKIEDAAPSSSGSSGSGGTSSSAAAAPAAAAAGDTTASESTTAFPAAPTGPFTPGFDSATYYAPVAVQYSPEAIAAFSQSLVVTPTSTNTPTYSTIDPTSAIVAPITITNRGALDAVMIARVETTSPEVRPLMESPATGAVTGLASEAADTGAIEQAFEAQIQGTGTGGVISVGAGSGRTLNVEVPALLAGSNAPINLVITALDTEGKENIIKTEKINVAKPSAVATAVQKHPGKPDTFTVFAIIEGPKTSQPSKPTGVTGAVVGFLTGAVGADIPQASPDLTLEMDMQKEAERGYKPTLKLRGLLESLIRGPKTSFSELFGPYDIKPGERVVFGQQFTYQNELRGNYNVEFDIRSGRSQLAEQNHNLSLNGRNEVS